MKPHIAAIWPYKQKVTTKISKIIPNRPVIRATGLAPEGVQSRVRAPVRAAAYARNRSRSPLLDEPNSPAPLGQPAEEQ